MIELLSDDEDEDGDEDEDEDEDVPGDYDVMLDMMDNCGIFTQSTRSSGEHTSLPLRSRTSATTPTSRTNDV